MHDGQVSGGQDGLWEALEHLQSALELLDRESAPGAIGAKVDLVIHDLYGLITSLRAGSRIGQIDRNAVPQ